MLAARGAIDKKYARCFVGVVMTALRSQDGLACHQPVDRDFVIRISKARTRLACERCFSRIGIGIPGGIDDGGEFALQMFEGGVDETTAIALFNSARDNLTGGIPLRTSASGKDGASEAGNPS